MIFRTFIFVLLLLAGIISTAATINAERIVISPAQDFAGPVKNNKTYGAHFSPPSKNPYAPYNKDKRISGNFKEVTENLSFALYDAIKLSANPGFGGYQFSGFFNNPSSSAAAMVIEGNYSRNSTHDTVVIDAHIRFSIPSNTYLGEMYLNVPYTHGLSDFGHCTKDYQIIIDDSEHAIPVPFPAAVYLLGTGLIVLCIFAHKNRVHHKCG